MRFQRKAIFYRQQRVAAPEDSGQKFSVFLFTSPEDPFFDWLLLSLLVDFLDGFFQELKRFDVQFLEDVKRNNFFAELIIFS